MTSWLFLFLTVGCAYVTYDAFRWRRDVERAPFSVIANPWKNGLSHLSGVQKADVQRRYSSGPMGVGQICWLFLTLTIILAVVTTRAFLI